MSNSEKFFEAGVVAFRDKKFETAIKYLIRYRQECEKTGDTKSQHYSQSQIGIIKSYQKLGRTEEAIALCQTLTTSNNEQLRRWASKMLTQRSATSTENPNPSNTSNTSNQGNTEANTALNLDVDTDVAVDADVAADVDVAIDAEVDGQREPLKTLDGENHELVIDSSAKHRQKSQTKQTAKKSGFSNKQTLSSGLRFLGGTLLVLGGRSFLKRLAKTGFGLVLGSILLVVKSCIDDGKEEQLVSCLSRYSMACESPLYPLYEAISNEDIEEVERLTKRRKNLNKIDSEGNTILFWASVEEHCDFQSELCRLRSQEHEEIVMLLMEQGADVTATNHTEETPLHWAARVHGSGEVMRAMLNRGADVNAEDIYQITPLHWAAYYGLTTNVEILLNRGSEINAKDVDGYTALDYAMFSNLSEETIELLKQRGFVSEAY